MGVVALQTSCSLKRDNILKVDVIELSSYLFLNSWLLTCIRTRLCDLHVTNGVGETQLQNWKTTYSFGYKVGLGAVAVLYHRFHKEMSHPTGAGEVVWYTKEPFI